ncbi:DUF397 domain-containing protein [Streptomyces chumphonensis]|uniref:DUF397 domain-containing protein n=2 Tax=Streptomyces chumphonensis TaxID=1214925 RepID=A0A927EYE4_9ACTN|nr:DUF397 domain-containing protein [Streptomyces chumphonensis]
MNGRTHAARCGSGSRRSAMRSACARSHRRATTGIVPVRDSKSPAGPVLNVSAAAFTTFVAGVKARQLGAA